MKKLLGKFVPVWGWITGARDWLTLLAVAAAAAFLWYKFATVSRDRDALLASANVLCAAAGSEFTASSTPDGKRLKRGELCLKRVRELQAFERDTLSSSNKALAGALETHNTKSEADAQAAARDFAAAAQAARNMEHAENAIAEDNRVGPDWFGAVNDLAGLRRKD